jgi:hypothetical protein
MAVELIAAIPTAEEIQTLLRVALEGARREYQPWNDGFLYAKLRDRGYSQVSVARACAVTQPYVSRCQVIYDGLSPGAHDMLCRMAREFPYKPLPSILRVVKLAQLRVEAGGPDQPAQLAELARWYRFGPGTVEHRIALVLSMPLLCPSVYSVLRFVAGETPSLEEIPSCPSPIKTLARPRRAPSPTPSTASTPRRRSSGSSPAAGKSPRS